MTDTTPSQLLLGPVAQKLLFVTGPAGAGRTTAVRTLEDLGYETTDNPPLHLVPSLIEGAEAPLAIAIDTRTRGFSVAALSELLDDLNDRTDVAVELLYLDCSVDVLLRRYSETRRRHPLAPDESPVAGVSRDFAALGPIRNRADALIDTTELSVHDLRDEVTRLYSLQGGSGLAVVIQSFSYKRGLPRGLDMVFDCRFLKNPHWNPALREFDGREPMVQDYIAEDPLLTPFFDKVFSLLELVLPASVNEGKSHFSVGFGCTGGKHRSVALTERTAKALAGMGWQVSIQHREVERWLGVEPTGSTGTLG